MKIVRVDELNVALLNNVAVDVFDNEISAEHLDAYLRQSGHVMFVAMKNEQVIGQIRGIVQFQPDGAKQMYVENLGVTPASTRNGIATKLMQSLVEWGKGEGCVEYWLVAEIDNEDALEFYKSAEFVKTDVVMFSKSDDN